jgi:hypothetical protein
VFIDTEEHRVVRETIAALTRRPGPLPARRHSRARDPRSPASDGILRSALSATIQAMPAANLRERMTRVASSPS